MKARSKLLASLFVAIVGTCGLLFATQLIGQQQKSEVGLYFLYQGVALCIALLTIAAVRYLAGGKLQYLSLGNFTAPARPIPLLGVKKSDSWRSVGVTFAGIITIATAVFLYITYKEQLPANGMVWLMAFLFALPLSALNAFSEEIVTRWTIAEAMTGTFARYAPWASAVLFGGVHYFGIPGGLTGSLMAGFLAWLLTRSIQDTKGIGWAWCIHFLQDILIFTVTLAVVLTK